MTQTMLELAARALFDTYTELAYGEDGCPAEEREEIWLEGRDGFIKSARAVLMAVRVPSEAMSQAVRTTEGWEDMIDFVLNERPR